MQSTHPFLGINSRLTVPAELAAYVEALDDLPSVDKPARVKPYWRDMGLAVEGSDPGVVPAGRYSDPKSAIAAQAVIGAYKAMGGRPITRHLMAVALNFQVSDDIDIIRKAYARQIAAAEGATSEITPGAPGRSVRYVVDTPEGEVTVEGPEPVAAEAAAEVAEATEGAAEPVKPKVRSGRKSA